MADTPETTIPTTEEPKIAIPKPLMKPPRSTGDAQRDYPLLLNWLQTAYQNILQAVQYINQQSQGEIDPDNLPDPSTATTAQAQQTANDAYEKAVDAEEKADLAGNAADAATATANAIAGTANTALTNANSASSDAATALSIANTAQSTANGAASGAASALSQLATIKRGTVTISGASTSAVAAISAQPDTAYTISLSAKAFTGTPPIDAFVVTDKTYTTGNFTVTVFGAPGIGNSVTYDWTLIRI